MESRDSTSEPVTTGSAHSNPPAPYRASLIADALHYRHAIERVLSHVPIAAAALELLAKSRSNRLAWIAPMLLAEAIERYRFDEGREVLRVALLGVERLDTGIEGRLFALVPWLIGRPHLQLQVELVGPKAFQFPTLTEFDEVLPPAQYHRGTVGEWLRKRGTSAPWPDLLVMFHPGLESHAKQWLAPGELPALLERPQPLLCFAYDMDEAWRDCVILNRFGVQTDVPERCRMSAIEPAVEFFDPDYHFGVARFLIQGQMTQPFDAAQVSDILDLSSAFGEVFANERRSVQHHDTWSRCFIYRGSALTEVLHVLDRIYFDPAAREFFIAQAGKEMLDLPPIPTWNETIEALVNGEGTALDRALTARMVYRAIAEPPPSISRLVDELLSDGSDEDELLPRSPSRRRARSQRPKKAAPRKRAKR